MRARSAFAASGATLAVATLHAGPALAPIVPGLGERLGVTMREPGSDGVALTFDDGPHPHGTPAVLELLREAGARATFFLAGEQVLRRPALAAEIVAAGHRVELHCHRHRALLSDCDRGKAAIEEASGQEVRDYRPPHGVFSAAGLRAIRARGWRPVLWSRWGRDWKARATPESIARQAAADIVAGDIVLLHDADYYSARGSWVRTAAALPAILEELARCELKSRLLRR